MAALALRGPLTSASVLSRMFAAGTAWGLATAAGFIGMTFWTCGAVSPDEAAITTALCVLVGLVAIGPLAAFGRKPH